MACRLFVTAFEPYDQWSENASWLALVEFTKSLSTEAEITTRLYPVDFDRVRQRLDEDLDADYDYALHLGQAPGSANIRLEAVGLNIGGNSREPSEAYRPLVSDGPVAYMSRLPLGRWVSKLRGSGIPATLSYHAGTYLCNATLYLTHYFVERKRLKTQATFIHLPLATSQAATEPQPPASLPPADSGRAIGLIVDSLITPQRQPDQGLA